VAHRLFELPVKKVTDGTAMQPVAAQQSLEAQQAAVVEAMAQRQSVWFDQEMAKLDGWAEDKRAGLKFDLKDLDDAIKELKKQIRQTGNLPDKLALQRKARDAEKKRDEAWRAYDEAAKHIEVEKDALLDRVEEQLAQSVATEDLFTITFQIA
jgi:predicted  nucleic acid-binding Zn-ribbon protein